MGLGAGGADHGAELKKKLKKNATCLVLSHSSSTHDAGFDARLRGRQTQEQEQAQGRADRRRIEESAARSGARREGDGALGGRGDALQYRKEHGIASDQLEDTLAAMHADGWRLSAELQRSGIPQMLYEQFTAAAHGKTIYTAELFRSMRVPAA
jgi:hypothetical protein